MPPWPWTIAFGLPVVPDEKSTNSGWSKATRLERERPGLGESSSQGARPRPRARRTERARRGASVGKGGADRRHLFAAVDRAVAEAVPADRQQHRGLELREAVDDAARRRARARSSPRPRRGSPSPRTRSASRGCSAGRRRRGRPGGRRAAGARPVRAPPARGSRQTRARAGSRVWECATIAVSSASSSWPSRCSAKFSRAPGNQVAPGIASEARTVLYGRVGLDLEELPDRRPETGEVVDRPAPQLARSRRRRARARARARRGSARSRSSPARRAAASTRPSGRAYLWPMLSEMSCADRTTAGPKRASSSSIETIVRWTARLTAAITSPDCEWIGRGDRPQAVGELLVVHGDAGRTDLPQLLAERLGIGERVRARAARSRFAR